MVSFKRDDLALCPGDLVEVTEVIEAIDDRVAQVHLYSRDMYADKIKGMRTCPFCQSNHEGECGMGVVPEYVLKGSDKWLWIVNPFPYWRYHTMLVPKRHITRIEEMSSEEFSGLQDMTHYALNRYEEAGLIHSDKSPVQDYVFFWRFRQKGEVSKFSHLHIHLAPDRTGKWDPILDADAYQTNVDLLKEGYVSH